MASLEHWSEHSHEMFKRLLDFSIAGDELLILGKLRVFGRYERQSNPARDHHLAPAEAFLLMWEGVEQCEICFLGSAEVRGRIASRMSHRTQYRSAAAL